MLGGDHQRRGTGVHGFVDVRALLAQEPHHVSIALLRRCDQRRPQVQRGEVGVGLLVEEDHGHLREALLGSEEESRGAVRLRRQDPGEVVHQELRHRHVVGLHRQVERRRATVHLQVDVSSARHQHLCDVDVPRRDAQMQRTLRQLRRRVRIRPRLAETSNNGQASQHRGRVQRRPAGLVHRHRHVGPGAEQIVQRRLLATLGARKEGRPAVGGGLVDLRRGLDHQPRHVGVSRSDAGLQGHQAFLGPRRRVGPHRDE
mmetsp:Transcript_8192/g.23409  ORF Transcript_8192/g.23409 Transcript_8192/m.23409 type:complete len:258 (+) Transcript_8192:577-1350(+)